MSNIQLPPEYSWVDLSNTQFTNALTLGLNSSQNLFIQGRAGSGKSLLIKIIASTLKNVIVLSTTGITAVELCSEKVAAKTIHSFMNLPPVPVIQYNDIVHLLWKNKKILNKAEVIIIDEVSMMSNNLFDQLCEKIVMHRNDSAVPRMILFGDVMQLPPVVNNDSNIVSYYQSEYNGKMMFFNGHWFKNMNFKICNLRKSFRQDEEEFADHLIEIGFKDHTQETLDYFNQRVMSLSQFEQLHSQYIYMAPTNKVIDNINNQYASKLNGKSYTYEASMSKNFPKGKSLNSDRVVIKQGAQVMCIMNHYADEDAYRYTNGMIGEVLDLDLNEVLIQLMNGQQKKIVASTTTLFEIDVDKYGQICYNPAHWYKQIDCKICRGVTIHKSQGKTFDAGYISLQGWTPPGLTYVALSRMRTLDGVGLSRPLKDTDIIVNTEAYEFLTY